MNDKQDDVTSNTTGDEPKKKRKRSENYNEEFGTHWYLKSHEYNKDKRRVRRETKKRMDSYGGVFS